MSVKRGLGRGLDALLGKAPVETLTTVQPGQDLVVQLPVTTLVAGRYQPRRRFDEAELAELTASIREHGVLQPIVVRRALSGGHEIVAGERRWRAAAAAGLETVPAVIREIDDQSALAIALIENIQRADLGPVEEAQAMRRLIDEFALTHQRVGELVGRNRATVSNLLRLLEIEPEILRMLDEGQIEMGHARALLGLTHSSQRLGAAHRVVDSALNVRQTEALVKSMLQSKPATPATSPKRTDVNVQALERELADLLGAQVAIRSGRGGSGELRIAYASHDELEGVLERLRRH